MIPHIIAIGGYKNSGKNEAASMLEYLLNSPDFMHTYKCYTLFHKWFVNKKYKITSFAYPLKRTLAALLNVDIKRFEDRKFKEYYYVYFPDLRITDIPDNRKILSDGKFTKMINNRDLSFLKTHYITIRQLLQVFGTEIMRNLFGDKLWILSTLNEKTNLIVSDLRFKVEYESVKENFGQCILIDREGCNPGNHASEKEIEDLYKNDKFDWIIRNDGTLEDLFNNLKAWYWFNN